MKIYQLHNYQDYEKFKSDSSNSYLKHIGTIEKLVPDSNIPFFVPGFSYPAKKIVDFHCDFEYGTGFPMVNWRERLTCPKTLLNN